MFTHTSIHTQNIFDQHVNHENSHTVGKKKNSLGNGKKKTNLSSVQKTKKQYKKHRLQTDMASLI